MGRTKLDSNDVFSLIIFSATLFLVLTTFLHYGITWDEPIQNQYGKKVLDFYTSFFRDHSYKSVFNLYLYGGLFDGTAALLINLSPIGEYETRHLFNGIIGILGLWGCWKIARLISGSRAAFWAALFLILTPAYYGHAFNNPKDIPFAVGYAWSVYYLLRLISRLPEIPAKEAENWEWLWV